MIIIPIFKEYKSPHVLDEHSGRKKKKTETSPFCF